MFGSRFYNSTVRKYTASFGTLFNDIMIERYDEQKQVESRIPVPLHFAPIQKYIAKLRQDPKHDAHAIILPRMSFEMMDISYDPSRRLGSNLNTRVPGEVDSDISSTFALAPYNMDFQLNIMVKNYEDGLKIVEQILPYFTPQFTMSVQMLEDHTPIDVNIVLNSVTKEDSYDSSFEERRLLIWTLNFTLKGYFFGPKTDKKVIKFIQTDLYSNIPADDSVATINVQPGLTANGEPTTSISNTIPYQDIEFEDDWDYIIRVEEDV